MKRDKQVCEECEERHSPLKLTFGRWLCSKCGHWGKHKK